MANELKVVETGLKGLYLIDLEVHADSRGSFREAYQAEKMEALGLPKLGPVQWNISENLRAGIVRGIHAEPWDKFIHVPFGSVYAAVTDLRQESLTFGQHEAFTLHHHNALFITRGFGNAFQALEPNTVYCYLVNAHFTMGLKYPSVAYNDPDINIQWPLSIGSDDVSDKDKNNPTLRMLWPDRFRG
jgi:dTDP-4-dehydrorhamnose 3,5-epimerase